MEASIWSKTLPKFASFLGKQDQKNSDYMLNTLLTSEGFARAQHFSGLSEQLSPN